MSEDGKKQNPQDLLQAAQNARLQMDLKPEQKDALRQHMSHQPEEVVDLLRKWLRDDSS
ncbi:MAG: hypothetical protein AAF442_07220 [Pseudomonadota bacterium]